MLPAKFGAMTAGEFGVNLAIAGGASPEVAARVGQAAEAGLCGTQQDDRAVDLVMQIGRTLNQWEARWKIAPSDYAVAAITLAMAAAKIVRVTPSPSGDSMPEAFWKFLADAAWRTTDGSE